ncbi:conserved Plasmodium protein, unknown function [Plasmodium berghei]|uniref:Uncharacterized protein n=2 Tax=Plasmodium berghei TaxID=5821 RepID=A0A509ALN4_PLABA|nr:conserved protein, unknown function [Plasmodium berghei ANKA]CXI60069.1 conserved Plasmodium protein, unknown function [Plasmodium berghei]SCM23527.1 conserved Plasmodium protein, unknown function [Plasmodium berghei]SCN26633.1 conserved Plasmodium protein, unknown function [Plasmodium berghei]SCO60902.1 conserved Plasmodium protein, unknown function [Plasmodium berghei]SCO62921.1 conserved Plasmodium protein, unknown function [Plasmodium berghei]|eukprot:XP_034422259.1 conserved protein, unknown function [Plasmodium berghei ANKA]
MKIFVIFILIYYMYVTYLRDKDEIKKIKTNFRILYREEFKKNSVSLASHLNKNSYNCNIPNKYKNRRIKGVNGFIKNYLCDINVKNKLKLKSKYKDNIYFFENGLIRNSKLYNKKKKNEIRNNTLYYFMQNKELKEDNSQIESIKKKNLFKLMAKMPVITVNRKLYPKEFSTDYENVLRKYNVTYINYKTRLRDKPEIDIKSIDDLYGQIYDRYVLKKQFYFFLYHDDINTCYKILTENPNVLTKEESFKILNSLPYIFVNKLKYIYPNEQNVDDILKKLIKTYIFQHGNDKNIDYLNFKYRYNELDEFCAKIASEGEDKENTSTSISTGKESVSEPIDIYDNVCDSDYEKKYANMSYEYEIIEKTKKYKDLIERFKKYPNHIKLEKVQLLYTKILTMKGTKLAEAFRKHESTKKNKERKIYRNSRIRIDPNKLTPYLNEPIKYDPKEKERINKLFEEYVNKKDLIKSSLILRKYTNLIDTKEKKSQDIMKNYLKLHEYIYKANKYTEDELKHLRMVYYSTVQKPRIFRKIAEIGLRKQGENVTHKEIYDAELNRYLKERNELRDQRMKLKGFDMDKIRDFSSAYSMEWLPVIYKDAFDKFEKEKNSKDSENSKYTINKKKETIKKLFTPTTDQNMTESKSDTEEKQKNQRGSANYDFLNGRDEMKIGRNILNYKKKKRGKIRQNKDKSSKNTLDEKNNNTTE